jgi:tetratricopeptide (TPR) repeat protein
VVFRYINFLLGMAQSEEMTGHSDQATRHFDDAILVAETCKKLDPYNEQITGVIKNVTSYKHDIGQRAQAFNQVDAMEATARTNPGDVRNLVMLGNAYMQMQQTTRAVQLYDTALDRPEINFQEAQSMAMAFAQIQDLARLSKTLKKMVSLAPDLPEARSDLAALEAMTRQTNEAIADLKMALQLNTKRLAKDPKANDLMKITPQDPRFTALHAMLEFQKLFTPP